MKVVNIPISNEHVIEFEVPDKAEDFTLRHQIEISELSIEYTDIEDEFQDFLQEVEEGWYEGDEDDIELTELDFRLKLINNLRRQLMVLLPENNRQLGVSNSKVISELPAITVRLLHSMVTMEETEEEYSICEFVFEPAVQPDLEFYQKKLEEVDPNIHTEQVFEYTRIINRLKSGEFILVPVQDNIFESKIATDNIMSKFPKMEEKDKEALENIGWDLNKLNLLLDREKYSEEELLEKRRQISAIKRYYKSYQNETWKHAANLLSHVCVPKGHGYNYDLAEKRAEYFMDLPINTVQGLLNFISSLIVIYQKNTLLSSRRQAQVS